MLLRDEYKYVPTAEEWEHVQRIAKLRQTKNRRRGVRDRRVAKADPVHIAAIGYLGEVVFGWFTGLEPDQTTHPRSGGVDFTLPDGRTVDVKTPLRLESPMSVYAEKERLREADLYALVVGNHEAMWYVGYARAFVMFDKKHWRPNYERPCYAMYQSQLCSYNLPTYMEALA